MIETFAGISTVVGILESLRETRGSGEIPERKNLGRSALVAAESS
jgi:hypothetical protein